MKCSWDRLAVITVAVLVIMSVVLTGKASAEGYTDDTRIAVVPGTVNGMFGAQVDGEWVVWAQDQAPSDHMSDERDVFAMHLDSGDVMTVASGAADQGAVLFLNDGVVVWTEGSCVGCGFEAIRGMDLATAQEFVVTEPQGVIVAAPVMAGSRIIWADRTSTDVSCTSCFFETIRSRDLSSDQSVVIAESDYQVGVSRLVASERWLVWSERHVDGEHSLIARDTQSLTAPVILARGDEVFPGGSKTPVIPLGHFDLSGDLVVWLERSTPDGWPTRLIARNLLTGEAKTLADPVNQAFDLHGTTVVYHQEARVTTGDEHVIALIDTVTGVQWTVLPESPGSTGGSIVTDGRFILWPLPSGGTAGYDLGTNASFVLPVNWSYVTLNDSNLWWFTNRAWVGETEIHTAPVEAFASGMLSRHFPETDHWLSLGFLNYWEQNGGLGVFGYPLSERGRVDGAGVWFDDQWLERQRFEWHPENAGTSYEVLLGRLGAELLEQQGRDWTLFEKADPSTPHYMAETGHAVASEFWTYWSQHGLDLGDEGMSFRESLALFGYPLSEPMMETNADGDTVLTQYFERAVFEWHPDSPEPYRVLLRRLGAEMLPVEE